MKLNACFFLIEDDELLKRHNKTWDKVNNKNQNRYS